MRDVYANSLCTVAAAASVNPDGGLFRKRESKKLTLNLVEGTWQNHLQGNYFIEKADSLDDHLESLPLHQRGWVLQERLLAPRVLHFGQEQIFWECYEEQKCEGFPRHRPDHSSIKDFRVLFRRENGHVDSDPKTISPATLELWNRIARTYAQCALTYPEDKLIALSGLVQLFQEKTGDEKFAGLWRSRLWLCLGWSTIREKVTRSLEYRAPSWSWMSLGGRLGYLPCVREWQYPPVSIVEAHIIPATSDRSAPVVDGVVRLRGTPFMATYRDQTEKYHVEDGAVSLTPWDVSMDVESESFDDGAVVYYLPLYVYSDYDLENAMMNIQGLVLRPEEQRQDSFTRIGSLSLEGRDEITKLGVIINVEALEAKMNSSFKEVEIVLR